MQAEAWGWWTAGGNVPAIRCAGQAVEDGGYEDGGQQKRCQHSAASAIEDGEYEGVVGSGYEDGGQHTSAGSPLGRPGD